MKIFITSLLFFYNNDFSIKNPKMINMPLSKNPKQIYIIMQLSWYGYIYLFILI